MAQDLARSRDVTVADVAKEARVSKAQAARALGGYGAVSDEVASRVLAAAELLRYRPNRLARSMNTGKSQTIGVIVGDIENPYFGRAIRGIYDTANSAGYQVILINTSERHETEVEGVNVLQDNRVDGFIVAPTSSPGSIHLQAVVDSGRPLVLLDRRVAGIEADAVASNSKQAAFEATAALLAAGHRRIGFVSTTKTSSPAYHSALDLGLTPVSDRLKGFEQAFAQACLPLPQSLVRLNAGDAAGIRTVVSDLLSGPDRVTAIIASDSVIAVSALEEVRSQHLTIPKDLSFIMFDDFPWTKIVNPPLTVVSQPMYELGVAAAETVLARIQHKTPPVLPDFAARLIIRDSIAPPPTP
ncbi:LacI family DNA-binding transcriptional regulator [Rhodoglobus sp. NPDC076762]